MCSRRGVNYTYEHYLRDRDVEMVNTTLKTVKFASLFPCFEQSH